MRLSEFFPVWEKLTPQQQRRLEETAQSQTMEKGTVLQRSSGECMGLLLVEAGQLRAFLLSDEGREITLYRLFERDICLFTASCMLQSIQFDITIEAEKDTRLLVIPAKVVREIMEESAPLSNMINEVMASRFSEVMWLIEQILWKSQDRRLAEFLLAESNLEESDTLTMTHEQISRPLGTAREVVTRMLRYVQREGLVELQRGKILLKDRKGLQKLGNK